MVAPKACHNCRSRRLRCDRSVPRCIKCASNGQECLGYGKLYKWVDNKAPEDQGARNNLVYDISHLDNKAYTGPKQTSEKVELRPQALHFPLLDPLFQDLDLSSRYYLNYYAVRFCQDLVIYDSPRSGANPFRELVPISQKYPFLREILVAASALHFSNIIRWNKTPREGADVLVDALCARHRAIKSVQAVIERQILLGDAEVDHGETNALLAAVLFFVNFALIDSGKGGWRAHMNFVGKLLSMRTLRSPQFNNSLIWTADLQSSVEPPLDASKLACLVSLPFAFPSTLSSRSSDVHDYIASDSMAYYIWSSVLDSLISSNNDTPPAPLTFNGDDTKLLYILLRTEANSYHSCPLRLLYIIFRTSQLARDIKTIKIYNI